MHRLLICLGCRECYLSNSPVLDQERLRHEARLGIHIGPLGPLKRSSDVRPPQKPGKGVPIQLDAAAALHFLDPPIYYVLQYGVPTAGFHASNPFASAGDRGRDAHGVVDSPFSAPKYRSKWTPSRLATRIRAGQVFPYAFIELCQTTALNLTKAPPSHVCSVHVRTNI